MTADKCQNDNFQNLVSLQLYGTVIKIMALFLLLRGSQAGLFYGLSTGEFCPLPLFPSRSLGARGFPHG